VVHSITLVGDCDSAEALSRKMLDGAICERLAIAPSLRGDASSITSSAGVALRV
jgi:hypothetical protein